MFGFSLPSSFPAVLRNAMLSSCCIGASWCLSAAPQDLRDFDGFIHHVRQEAGSGEAERILDCFAATLATSDGCGEANTLDLLGTEAQRFGWKVLGRDLARFADGFVLIDADGTMANLHARAHGQQHLLEVLGDRVKFRRSPGADGEVIAMLDRGFIPGRVDEGRWVVERNGIQWTPLTLDHPELGKIKGFIGSDYVRPSLAHGDVRLTARYDGSRWALTGYERMRKELEVTCCGPMP